MTSLDISGVSKPASVAAVIRRANEYIAVMRGMGKPVSRVAIGSKHYDAILRSVNAGRENGNKVDSLRFGDGIEAVRQ